MTKLVQDFATVLLYQGDDKARLADLYRAAQIEERNEQVAALRIGDEGETSARDAYNAAVDEAAERAVEVRVSAIGHVAFRELLAAHPPRTGNKEDEQVGFNQDSFPVALLSYVDPDEDFADPEAERTLAPDGFASPQALAKWLRRLKIGHFEEVFWTAYSLNRSGGADPKESKFLSIIPNTDETSDSPGRLG